MMNKQSKIIVGIVLAAGAFMLLYFIHGVMAFFGYATPVEREFLRRKTDAALEKRYAGHDFTVEMNSGWGEYGYYKGMTATDENGIEFMAQWIDGELDDRYHEEWNKFYYGEKIVEYQNSLRDELFPQIPYVDTYEYSADETYDFFRGPYKEVFFESMDEAIEGSKSNRFDTYVTFKGIDLYKADDEEIERFADSMADSLMWLYDETGYHSIRINDFSYSVADEYGDGVKNKDELTDSIIKDIERARKREEKNNKK